MDDRFTHRSDVGVRKISAEDRAEVYRRDDYTCQYCDQNLAADQLSIDHLVPVSRNGLDEITNYVTCCRTCNSRKRDTPLEEFALRIGVAVMDLPVHGDPIIDNQGLPIQIRLLRKRIFDKARVGLLPVKGIKYQQRLEKEFRRAFWSTAEGQRLESQFPSLPGHARVMLPEIQTIANSEDDFWLLIELAKSANTRNLIGTVLTSGASVLPTLAKHCETSADDPLKKRIRQAVDRFRKRKRPMFG